MVEIIELKPDYWDKEVFKDEYEVVRRFNSPGGRMYFRYDNEENKVWYISVTNALSKVMPESPFLTKWKMDKGEREAERLANAAADYGTMLHVFLAQALIKKHFDFDDAERQVHEYAREHPSEWTDLASQVGKLKDDMAALMQWAHDYQVKLLASEVIVYSDELLMAGAIDIICELNGPRNTRSLAFVDLKSGRNGFNDKHAVQLEIYRKLWAHSYPAMPQPNRIINIAPKAWKKDKPTYHMQEWTEKNCLAISCVDEYAAILKKTQMVSAPRVRNITGKVKVGDTMEGHIHTEEY